MYFVFDVLRVMLGTIEASKTWGCSAAVRRSIPLGNTNILKPTAEERADAACQVVTEALSHSACFRTRTESGNLVVLNRMTVLVPDHFRIFGVIHASGSITDLLGGRRVERVVLLQAIHGKDLLAIVHIVETKALDIGLG